MGPEVVKNCIAEVPLWQRYADQFPVRENLVYLNHAAVAPLPRRCADALEHLAEDCLHYGSLHYSEWLAVYEGLRVAAARLVNADPREIALVKNTSEGIATLALGLDWQPGDRMVGFLEEFPANLYPWKRLEAKGVEVTWLSIYDSLEKIEQACRGARLLAISFVQFLGGYRAPIQEIGEICRRNRCIYFVDAIQGLGAFPLDVRACHIDALAADGHKWLLGPEGCAILYINQALPILLRGWHSGARCFSARCPGLPHRRARRRRAQVAAGPGRLRHPLHKSGTSGPRGTGRIRLDQRGWLRRLRLSGYDLAAGCWPV